MSTVKNIIYYESYKLKYWYLGEFPFTQKNKKTTRRQAIHDDYDIIPQKVYLITNRTYSIIRRITI